MRITNMITQDEFASYVINFFPSSVGNEKRQPEGEFKFYLRV